MIAVVDYGMGNLRSVAKALERVGGEVAVTADHALIDDADAVVLPGVGAFGRCMENLLAAGLEDPVRKAAKSGKPFLGVCVGMQILFEESEEFGPVAGLGILPGRVRRFRADSPEIKVPHMGWNQLAVRRRAPHLQGIDYGENVYFVHSYYVDCDPALVATTTPRVFITGANGFIGRTLAQRYRDTAPKWRAWTSRPTRPGTSSPATSARDRPLAQAHGGCRPRDQHGRARVHGGADAGGVGGQLPGDATPGHGVPGERRETLRARLVRGSLWLRFSGRRGRVLAPDHERQFVH